MENENYIDFVNNQIELDKLLSSVDPKNQKLAKELFNKRKDIIKKNGIFADFQLKRINKKINCLYIFLKFSMIYNICTSLYFFCFMFYVSTYFTNL